MISISIPIIYIYWESVKSNNKSNDDLSSMFKVKLLTKTESATSFLKNLSSEIYNFTKHHDISEDQKKKKKKKTVSYQ